MSTLAQLVPTPANLPCGGEVVRVDEFRIRDLAELQSVLDARRPDPCGALRARLADAPPGGRAAIIDEAMEWAETGRVQVGTPEGNAYFSTPEGAAFVLWLATRRTPGMTPARAAGLFVRATASEVGAIWRKAYGVSPVDAVESLVFAPELLALLRAPGGGKSISWPESIDALSVERNWTYEYIYNLTLSEFGIARRHGEPKTLEVGFRRGPKFDRALEAQRRWLEG